MNRVRVKIRSVVLLLCVLSASAALSGCRGKAPAKQALLPVVTVAPPFKQPVTDYLEFTGNADASETVQLQARVSGFLTKAAFKDGDFVKQGDLLFEIEPEPYAAKVKLAQAAVAGAAAELQRATLEYNRQLDLVKKNAVAVADVEKWRAQRDNAQAALDQNQAQLDIANIDLSYTQVRAPFDGRVDRRLKDPGNLVGAGEATLLTTIYHVLPIYVYFSINEKDLVKIRQRPAASDKPVVFGAIEGDQGYPMQGYIDYAASAVDPGTGTLQLRAVFENPAMGRLPKVLPGMYVRLRLPVNQRPEALLVPDAAIGVDQAGSYVLVAGADDLVDKKPVTTGARAGELRVIESGLNGDERVVVNGFQQARPGSKVKPVPVPAQAPADQQAQQQGKQQ